MAKKPKARGTVLVTGAAKRIGKAICLSLSSLGFSIALHYYHSSREAEKLTETIKKKGGKCQLFQCDLSSNEQTSHLISNVLKKFPNLNLLINNASLFEPSTIKDSNTATLRKHFAVNFDAPYILTAQFAKKCKKGHIINILDTHIVNHATRYTSYLLSKKALCELTKISAVELAPNIRVNAISPGLILPSAKAKSDYLQRLTKKIPLQKRGNARHITCSIAFLLNNPYLTGQIIFNDGGEHLI